MVYWIKRNKARIKLLNLHPGPKPNSKTEISTDLLCKYFGGQHCTCQSEFFKAGQGGGWEEGVGGQRDKVLVVGAHFASSLVTDPCVAVPLLCLWKRIPCRSHTGANPSLIAKECGDSEDRSAASTKHGALLAFANLTARTLRYPSLYSKGHPVGAE